MIRAVVVACAVAAIAAVCAPAAGAALKFSACKGTRDARCTRLSVPLDRSGAVPGKLSLLVARDAPARGKADAKVLFALSGGPGQPGVFTAGLGREALGKGAAAYTIYGLDQRGTGESGVLECGALQRSMGTSDFAVPAPGSVEACGEKLGDRRGLYTSTATVEDLEALRAAIGVDKIALYGVSYGTYTAERYARAHPDRVERLILDSVVPQENIDPLAVPNISRVRDVLTGACSGGRCRAFTSDPVDDMARVVGGLPLRGPLYDGKGKRTTARLADGPALLDSLVATSFSAELAARYPAAVRSARNGDPAPLLRIVSITRRLSRGSAKDLSSALHTATLCSDVTFPWGGPGAPLEGRRAALDAAAAAVAPALLRPFGAATAAGTGSTVACERWPVTPGVAAPPAPGPLPDVPTLLISGTRDLSTPTSDAQRELARAPRGQLLVVPGTGHSVTTSAIPCVLSGLSRFFRDRAVGEPCRGKDQSFDTRAIDPPRLADVTPLRGVSGTPGRAIEAALETVLDTVQIAFEQYLGSSVRFGGLRGGSAFLRVNDAPAVDFDRVVYVPGIALTGRFAIDRRIVGSATISGRFKGRLTLRSDGDGVITLDGKRYELSQSRRWSVRTEGLKLRPR